MRYFTQRAEKQQHHCFHHDDFPCGGNENVLVKLLVSSGLLHYSFIIKNGHLLIQKEKLEVTQPLIKLPQTKGLSGSEWPGLTCLTFRTELAILALNSAAQCQLCRNEDGKSIH